MMHRKFRWDRFQVTTGFCIVLAVSLLVVPLPWILAWLVAAYVHEMGHIIAIISGGHRIDRVIIDCWGAKIYTDFIGKDEWYCALAGSFFALLLLMFIRVIPRVAICAVAQSAFNLLPILPLDGGRALRSILLVKLDEENAHTISQQISTIFMLVFLCLSLYLLINKFSLTIVLMSVLFLIKILRIKIPCKRGGKWVQ